jgi:16S rRNA (adenine1518-N6/adenine1519-N6)-dimethyltransferase
MIEYASLISHDTALDIGAGFGFLTECLAEKCKCVLAVESDPKLAKFLHERFRDAPKIRVFEGDILKVPIPTFNKAVSIPPYWISSRLLLWLFDREFDSAVLIFQREFADRLVASINSDDYGWLTVVTYYHSEVELLDAVPKASFYPEPGVGSVIVRVTSRASVPFHLKNEAMFNRLVQSVFTERNRKVRNACVAFLKSAMKVQKQKTLQMVENIPFRDKRVRELSPEDFAVLANAFVD